jgi:hypothetical protein
MVGLRKRFMANIPGQIGILPSSDGLYKYTLYRNGAIVLLTDSSGLTFKIV